MLPDVCNSLGTAYVGSNPIPVTRSGNGLFADEGVIASLAVSARRCGETGRDVPAATIGVGFAFRDWLNIPLRAVAVVLLLPVIIIGVARIALNRFPAPHISCRVPKLGQWV